MGSPFRALKKAGKIEYRGSKKAGGYDAVGGAGP